MSLAGETGDLGERAEERKQTWAIDLRREDWRGQSWSCHGVNDAPCLAASVDVWVFIVWSGWNSSLLHGHIQRPIHHPFSLPGEMNCFPGALFSAFARFFRPCLKALFLVRHFCALGKAPLDWGCNNLAFKLQPIFFCLPVFFCGRGGFMSALWFSPEIGLSAQE